MIGILIATHGRVSEALVDAAAMLVSDTQAVRAVTFLPGQGVEDLDAAVRQALAELNPNDGVLALVDIPGGSPARVVGGLLPENERLELLTGANLPMLVEALMLRDSLDLQQLSQHALAAGQQGIIDVGALFRAEVDHA